MNTGSNELESSYMQLRKKISISWFTGVSLLLIFIVYQLYTNSFVAQYASSVWQWFAISIVPLSLMILYLFKSRKEARNLKYKSLGRSIPLLIFIYIFLCFSPLFFEPFFNKTTAEIITLSYTYIIPMQILLLLLIDAYFNSKNKKNEQEVKQTVSANEKTSDRKLISLINQGKAYIANNNLSSLTTVCERLVGLGAIDEALQLIQSYYRINDRDHNEILALREELTAIQLDKKDNEISTEKATNKISKVKDSLINIIRELKVSKAS